MKEERPLKGDESVTKASRWNKKFVFKRSLGAVILSLFLLGPGQTELIYGNQERDPKEEVQKLEEETKDKDKYRIVCKYTKERPLVLLPGEEIDKVIHNLIKVYKGELQDPYILHQCKSLIEKPDPTKIGQVQEVTIYILYPDNKYAPGQDPKTGDSVAQVKLPVFIKDIPYPTMLCQGQDMVKGTAVLKGYRGDRVSFYIDLLKQEKSPEGPLALKEEVKNGKVYREGSIVLEDNFKRLQLKNYSNGSESYWLPGYDAIILNGSLPKRISVKEVKEIGDVKYGDVLGARYVFGNRLYDSWDKAEVLSNKESLGEKKIILQFEDIYEKKAFKGILSYQVLPQSQKYHVEIPWTKEAPLRLKSPDQLKLEDIKKHLVFTGERATSFEKDENHKNEELEDYYQEQIKEIKDQVRYELGNLNPDLEGRVQDLSLTLIYPDNQVEKGKSPETGDSVTHLSIPVLLGEEILPKTYKVTFDLEGDLEKIPPQKVKEGEKVQEPQAPKKDNYIFLYWEKDGKKFNFSSPVKEEMTLKAIYKEKVNKEDLPKPGSSGDKRSKKFKKRGSEKNPLGSTLWEGLEKEEKTKVESPAYLKGYPDGTIRPDGFLTRAEVASILVDLTGLEKSNLEKPNFKDTPSSWYNESINALVQAGLMKGYPDGSFRPNAEISRGEFVQAIKKLDRAKASQAPFADVQGHWAMEAINQAYGKGYIKGYPDGTFRPEDKIKRCEAVVICNRLFKRSPSKKDWERKSQDIQFIKTFKDLSPTHWAYEEILEAANPHK